MSNVANQLVIAEREDVARGVRLLLATPLVSERVTPEAFDLLRRRREPITKWFDYYCGWSVLVEPRLGYVRLVKVRAQADPTRPARRSRSGQAPFDRRRYTLLCLLAAELLAAPVTTIGLLADKITQATAAEPVIDGFDTSVRSERIAYVDVLEMLESFGAIEAVDGETESFVESASAKVLYRVETTLVMRLLAAPNGPSQFAVPGDEIALRFDELLAAMRREGRYGDDPDAAHAADGASDVQRTLWLRHSVFRRLVDDPVVYRDDLSAAEITYLASPHGRRLLRRAAEQGGFLLEERAEGVLFVDPEGLATDVKFPDDGSNAKVAALLLLDVITASDGGVARELLTAEADRLLREFPRWAKGYRGDDGRERLVSDAVSVLSEFGLVRATEDRVVPLPAASRYAVKDAGPKEASVAEAVAGEAL